MHVFIWISCMIVSLPVTWGHGRLIDPPSRGSMWRFGFSTPENYNDHQLNCGGFKVQWEENNGKCGICGDPWPGPGLHEAGGPFAKGIIVKQYTKGQSIKVKVEITANHKGWFEFRLCEQNRPDVTAVQECFDRHLLQLEDGSGSRYNITNGPSWGLFDISLHLPPDVTCSQCILQWKYNTGNSWGVDPITNVGCVGCGRQEQFYGCADIAID